MNRNSKLVSIFAAAFALALAFALSGCGQQGGSAPAASSTPAETSAAAAAPASAGDVAFALQVDATRADKGMLFDANATAKAGTTVYQALVDTGLDLKVDSTSGTVYVDGIAGVVASETGPNAGWLFTVNGEMPSVGADGVEIAEGDSIVWTFYPDATAAM